MSPGFAPGDAKFGKSTFKKANFDRLGRLVLFGSRCPNQAAHPGRPTAVARGAGVMRRTWASVKATSQMRAKYLDARQRSPAFPGAPVTHRAFYLNPGSA